MLTPHIPCIIFKRQTKRPQTSRSETQSNDGFCNNLFPLSCSKYPRLTTLVNLDKQSPRKELGIPGFPLEYEPKFDLVFPRPMTASIIAKSKKDNH